MLGGSSDLHLLVTRTLRVDISLARLLWNLFRKVRSQNACVHTQLVSLHSSHPLERIQQLSTAPSLNDTTTEEQPMVLPLRVFPKRLEKSMESVTSWSLPYLEMSHLCAPGRLMRLAIVSFGMSTSYLRENYLILALKICSKQLQHRHGQERETNNCRGTCCPISTFHSKSNISSRQRELSRSAASPPTPSTSPESM